MKRDDVAKQLRALADVIDNKPHIDIEIHVFAQYEEPLSREILELQQRYPYLNVQPKSGRSKLVLNTR